MDRDLILKEVKPDYKALEEAGRKQAEEEEKKFLASLFFTQRLLDLIKQTEADDAVKYSSLNFPLPIIHSDFHFDVKEVPLISREDWNKMNVKEIFREYHNGLTRLFPIGPFPLVPPVTLSNGVLSIGDWPDDVKPDHIVKENGDVSDNPL